MAGATARRLPYKDFLQPALQRRFATSGSVILVIAYLEGLLLSSWNSWLWAWFPIGPASLRTFFIFLCGVSIIILRIHQYHPGVRTSSSAANTFVRNIWTFNTVEAICSYASSALLFSQIYLWCMPEDSGLEWITYYMGDRARLNEKAVFFTTHCIVLGIYHGIQHLYNDTDRLTFGVARPKNKQDAQDPAKRALEEGDSGTQWQRLGNQMPEIAVYTLTQSLTGTTLTMVVYVLVLRTTIWQTLMLLLRPLYNLPRTNMTPSTLPFSISMIVRCLWVSVLLTFSWSVANAAFSLFLVKNPLKNNQPLSSESKDSNGSLLNGLKQKKLSIKCFAMWELAYIARDFPERRKAIYEDLDRKNGPTWSQVYDICIQTLKTIESNIDSYGAPAPAPTPSTTAAVVQKERTTEAPKESPIFAPSPDKKKGAFRATVEKTISTVATSPGKDPVFSPAAKKMLDSTKDQLVKAQEGLTGSSDTQGLFREYTIKFVKSPLGKIFRQEYSRRLTQAVLGGPYGEPSLYMNAAYALSGLAVKSLNEDKYGHVQRDVAAIIRALTGVIKKLDGFKAKLDIHWTDVEGKKESKDVDEILGALKDSLEGLLGAFGPYARDLRLSLGDIRAAREAAGLNDGKEMREVVKKR
ncbi:putative nuclear envelope protein ndc1 [Podospora fimiseda]|uniref:Nuclear envelope protein ndc1 n=1 Tax=Podospora fimiseda TaxID=252190 RepID=A0AAN7BRN2_9PEZI|nr:putative nuclear envelope protein ndc1 [Podospora fimiseda]